MRINLRPTAQLLYISLLMFHFIVNELQNHDFLEPRLVRENGWFEKSRAKLERSLSKGKGNWFEKSGSTIFELYICPRRLTEVVNPFWVLWS